MSCSRPARRAVLGLAPSSWAIIVGQLGDLDRVGEHVLAVAGAKAQPAEQFDQLGVHALHPGVEHALLTELDDAVVQLGLGLVVGLLDPRGMDPAVLQQLLQGEPRHLTAHAVKTGEHHRARCVVDDEIHAGEVLQRPDVAALATDDPSLHVIGRELDDGHGRLGGVAGGQALHAHGENVADPSLRLALGLLLDLAQAARGVVLGRVLDLLEQELLGPGPGHPGQLLEPGLDIGLTRGERLALGREGVLALLELFLAASQGLLAAVQARRRVRSASPAAGWRRNCAARHRSRARLRAVSVRRARRRPRSRPR